jgi:nucleoid DNA-binding protein
MNTTITINASDIAREVAQRAPVGQGLSKDIVSIVFETIAHELAEGHEVRISGFASFKVTQRAASVARNPRTGEAIEIPVRRSVKLRLAKGSAGCNEPGRNRSDPAPRVAWRIRSPICSYVATLPVNLQQRQGLRQADTAGSHSARRGLPALIGTLNRPHRARQPSSSWHDAVAAPSPLPRPGRPVEDSGDTPGCRPR